MPVPRASRGSPPRARAALSFIPAGGPGLPRIADWRLRLGIVTIWLVNEESLKRVNAFLSAIATRIEVGQVLTVTPADIGREVGLPEPLAAARAVRALL